MAPNRHDSASVMTAKELAAYLCVHPSTVYRLLKRHELPAFKIGSDWRFHRESIDRRLRNRERAFLDSSVSSPGSKASMSNRQSGGLSRQAGH